MEIEDQETERCSNCKREIPARNIQMHELQCRRLKLKECEKCGEMIREESMAEHEEEEHKEVECGLCKAVLPENDLADHKQSDCKYRPVLCPYCDLNYPLPEFDEHEDGCGSRTDNCDKCLKPVMLRNMNIHHESGCRDHSTETQQALWSDSFAPPHLAFRSHTLLPKINNTEANSGMRRAWGPAAYQRQRQAAAFRPPMANGLVVGGADELILPCEFCDEPFPAQALEDHQAECQEIQVMNIFSGRSRQHGIGLQVRHTNSPRKYSPVPVRGNLGPTARHRGPRPPRSQNDESRTGTGSDVPMADPPQNSTQNSEPDEFRIPCEFCQEPLLPDDFERHQADCEANFHAGYSGFGGMSAYFPESNIITRNDPNNSRKPAFLAPYVPDQLLASALSHSMYDRDDEAFVECGLCTNPVPITELANHELACQIRIKGTITQSMKGGMFPNAAIEEDTGGSQHAQLPQVAERLRSLPLDNDDDLTDRNESSPVDFVSRADTYDQEITLPCEFCGDEFPASVLTQHQYVCSDNTRYAITPYPNDDELMGRFSNEPASRATLMNDSQARSRRTGATARNRGLEGTLSDNGGRNVKK